MPVLSAARAVVLAAALAGCAPCRDGTLFLEMTFPGDVAAADQVDVIGSLDGGPEHHQLVARSRGAPSDSVEVEIPGYRDGGRLAVRVAAIAGGVRIGVGSQELTLAHGCTSARIAVADLACPAPSASGPTWVDADNGSDDPRYGGGERECANRTITYALRNDGVIHLAPATYGPGERLSLVLTGTQSIQCHGATIDGTGVTKVNAVLQEIVTFTGGANGLHDCTIIGGGVGDDQACVMVPAPASAGRHVIDGCDISQCSGGRGTAIYVASHSDPLTISNCFLHQAARGIGWGSGGDHAGSEMIDNRFDAITDADIFCEANNAASGLTGLGNQHSDGGTPCETCAGCPF